MMSEFWNILVYDNVINFVILVVILAFVFIKFNFGDKLALFKNNIIERIESSKEEKANAEKNLSEAKEYFGHLDNDIKECVGKIEAGANSVIEDIDDAIKRNSRKINDNTERFMANETNKVLLRVSSGTYESALKKAQKTIKEKFETDSGLHKKYIERSLDIFERMEL